MSFDLTFPFVSRHRLLILLGTACIFAVAHTQAPLYFSNQNQYFLHGAAAAGEGSLSVDWLAQTLDPTPVFSRMVEWIYRHLDEFIFYVIFFVLCCIYFISLLAIAARLIPDGQDRYYYLLIVGTMLIAIHAGIARLLSVRLTGVDYPWYAQSGVAGQYVLGPGLQPSAFGVFLVSSVAAFSYNRLVVAIICSSLACIVHATYLFPAAFLTLAYIVALLRERRRREAILLGLVSMIAVLPVVIYSMLKFAPTSPELFRESQHILAQIRIPHHTTIQRWFDILAAIQVGTLFLAILWVRKTQFFLLLGIPAPLGLALTIIQLLVESDSLSLLFPWRISVVLVPIATTILLTRLAQLLPIRRSIACGCLLLLLGSLIGGIVVQSGGLAYLPNEQETQALEYIRDHREPGDVYLLPVHIPKPTPGKRGVTSTSFTPPPTGKQKHLIAVDLQRFRLFTGVPIYVDFKSIPYKDTEVLEWFRRLKQCSEWYTRREWDKASVRAELRREGITHILLPAEQSINASGYILVHSDHFYRIYAVNDSD